MGREWVNGMGRGRAAGGARQSLCAVTVLVEGETPTLPDPSGNYTRVHTHTNRQVIFCRLTFSAAYHMRKGPGRPVLTVDAKTTITET